MAAMTATRHLTVRTVPTMTTTTMTTTSAPSTPPMRSPTFEEALEEAPEGEMDFDMLFEHEGPGREAEAEAEAEAARAARERAREGFDVGSVVIRCARLLCAPRGEKALRALRALKRVKRELASEEGEDLFKDDSRRAHVRESGLETLATALRSYDPSAFGGLERTRSALPNVDSEALHKLDHAYLWLPPDATPFAAEYASVEERIIIEPNLRSHFVVGRASESYARLVDALPECFVGSFKQISEIVHFISSHMLDSFRESGLDVPPWRRPSALTSKWTVCLSDVCNRNAAPSPSRSPSGPFDFFSTTFDGGRPGAGKILTYAEE